jgi:hypothetical protein
MEFIVRVEARLARRVVKVCDVVTIARPGVVRGEEELGLSLEDGKEIVRELQSRMIAVQVEMLEAANSLCIHCGRATPSREAARRGFAQGRESGARHRVEDYPLTFPFSEAPGVTPRLLWYPCLAPSFSDFNTVAMYRHAALKLGEKPQRFFG